MLETILSCEKTVLSTLNHCSLPYMMKSFVYQYNVYFMRGNGYWSSYKRFRKVEQLEANPIMNQNFTVDLCSGHDATFSLHFFLHRAMNFFRGQLRVTFDLGSRHRHNSNLSFHLPCLEIVTFSSIQADLNWSLFPRKQTLQNLYFQSSLYSKIPARLILVLFYGMLL